MRLIKCSNNHFYDADKYSMCPHCMEGGGAQDSYNGANAGSYNYDDINSGGPYYRDEGPGGTQRGDDPNWRPFGDGPTGPTVNGYEEDVFYQKTPPETPQTGEPEDDNTHYGFDGVVGWLVVKNLTEKGRSKELRTGNNFIGKKNDNDVVLAYDDFVSRHKHAAVMYEPLTKKFYAIKGEGKGLLYVNGEVVLNSVSLNPYDVITVGKTELIFIPLCGENFAWEEE